MRLITRVGLALMLMSVLAVPTSPSAQRLPIKIGVLLPFTGVIAVNGQETSKGIEFLLGKIGGSAGGREIQILREDDEAKPDVGLTKVRKLVESEVEEVKRDVAPEVVLDAIEGTEERRE